jgi:hypothetical protein
VALEDVNGDGFTDLISHYSTAATDIAPGQGEACITGQLDDGTLLEGCASIVDSAGEVGVGPPPAARWRGPEQAGDWGDR